MSFKIGRFYHPLCELPLPFLLVSKASTFYIKCDDPTNEQAVIEEIHRSAALHDFLGSLYPAFMASP